MGCLIVPEFALSFSTVFPQKQDMARTKRSVSLDTRNKRLALQEGVEHVDTLSAGCYIIYYRPRKKGGVWRARSYDPATKKMVRLTIGGADDFLDADDIQILTWEQATKKAGAWFKGELPVGVRRSVRQPCLAD